MGKSLILNVSCFFVIVNQRAGQNLFPDPALSCDAARGDWSSVSTVGLSTARFYQARLGEYDEAWLKTS
jgi:hypothetical protein